MSTVFLGYDVRTSYLSAVGPDIVRRMPPLLFETRIFLAGDHEAGAWHYCTEAAARHGHRALLDAIRAGRADRGGPARRGPARTAGGPWRRGYPNRWQ